MGMIMKDGVPYGGVYPIDDVPTQGSDNTVKSGGVFSALSNKVDKVEGKGLSTNDYSDTEKGKVSANTEAIEAIEIENGAYNILPNNASTATVGEITFTVNADKSVTATGNQPSTYRSIALCTGLLLKAGTYVLSKVAENTLPLYLYMSNDDQSGAEIATCLTTPVSFTLANDTHVSVLAVVRPGTGAANATIYPMIYDARFSPTGYVQHIMPNKELTDFAKHFVTLDFDFSGVTDLSTTLTQTVKDFNRCVLLGILARNKYGESFYEVNLYYVGVTFSGNDAIIRVTPVNTDYIGGFAKCTLTLAKVLF